MALYFSKHLYKKSMKYLYTLSLSMVLALAGCKTASSADCIETAAEGCMCTRQFDPVCGCNEKTYGNACEAECHGITNYTKGACKESE